MFVDEIEITLKAGHGGAGKASFFPGKHSGPDGGNGGKGADLYVIADAQVTNLNHYLGKSILVAGNGGAAGSFNRSGAAAEDLVIKLPISTLLIDTKTSEEIELTTEGQKELLCIGGKGGKGNTEFKSSSRTAPTYAQKGLNGQERRFKILVRMIADFGLIGLPNAGKSSLLNELTNAKAEVADYPFTTLEPNLGVLNSLPATPGGLPGGRGKVIADIPGLIEGASEGKGLGIKFLKHIEKVKLLLHCISSESTNVVADYKTIIKELKEYNPQLLDKKQVILLTKSDLVSVKDLEKKMKQLKKFKYQVMPISIHNWDSLESLKILVN